MSQTPSVKTQTGPNGGFNASTTAISGAATRPSGGTKRKASFDVQDLSNSALRRIATPSGMLPRGTVDAPFRQLGRPQQTPSGARAMLMTGAGSSKEESTARYNTGMGGISEAAFRKIEQYAPPVPSGDQFKMPGHKDLRFGQHEGSEWGVPSFAGFGSMRGEAGVQMFRTGAVVPTSRSGNGLMFNGFGSRPTELDSQRAIHGVPNTDPRRPPGTIGGPNGPPLASAVSASTSSPQSLTEKKPYEDVNAVVQKGHIVRPFAPSFNPDDNYGQFMVIHRSVASLNADSAPRTFAGPAAAQGMGGAQFRFTELSVTAFNYLLASREEATSTINAKDVLRNWEMSGAVINESSTSVVNNADRTTNNATERLVNLCNAGPCSVYNYWGRKALQGNITLYFILKRVPRAQLAKLAQGRPFQAEARRMISASLQKGTPARVAPVEADTLYYKLGEKKDYLTVWSRDASARPLHPAPFQLVPYATNGWEPVPLAARRYTNPLTGDTEYGVVIRVGYSDYPLNQGRAEDGMAGMVDASRLADSGLLRIFASIETHA